MPIKIRFIKDCDEGLVGDIKNYSNASAKSFVEQGYAEYAKDNEFTKWIEQEILPLTTGFTSILRNEIRDKIRYSKDDNDLKNNLFIINKEVNLEELREKYNKLEPLIVNNKKKQGYSIMTRRGQLEKFWEKNPFYYDTSKIFWLWNKEEYKWVISDEVDFCNSIFENLNIDTINSKDRGEIIEGFKQIGRKHKPKKIHKTWIQFKNKIYDVKTGESFEATPEYFVTNPIPWKVGESEETPLIDKYFDDWTKGKDLSWKDTLYEIIAYNTTTDKFMQRIICLCGGGSNGKGTFIKLNYKFLGEENCVSSEIKTLSENIFEPAVLYRKLLCVMGEVTYDDLKNTNQLKKLGGEDKISFQFKGKTPFTDDNTVTCICLTNSMPITPDKTIGFYRKWLIIDFLNQFKQIDSSLIDIIPDIEFENLAKKSLRILKELYENPHFTNEGSFEDRARIYEERSNPIMRFISEYCEEIAGENISLREFTNICNEYLKSKHLRIMSAIYISKILRNEGFIVGHRRIDDIPVVVILNLRTTKTTETTIYQNRNLHEETAKKFSSFSSFSSFDGKNKLIFTECKSCGLRSPPAELNQDGICDICSIKDENK